MQVISSDFKMQMFGRAVERVSPPFVLARQGDGLNSRTVQTRTYAITFDEKNRKNVDTEPCCFFFIENEINPQNPPPPKNKMYVMTHEELKTRIGQARDKAHIFTISNRYRSHLSMMGLGEDVENNVVEMLKECYENGYISPTQGFQVEKSQETSLYHGIGRGIKIDDYVEQINKYRGVQESDVYEITEINEHEGETFGYIVELSKEELSAIQEYFTTHNEEWGYEVKSIKEFELTHEQVELINRYNSGTYSKRLKYMKLSEQFRPDAAFLNEMDFAYKGSGMVEEKPS